MIQVTCLVDILEHRRAGNLKFCICQRLLEKLADVPLKKIFESEAVSCSIESRVDVPAETRGLIVLSREKKKKFENCNFCGDFNLEFCFSQNLFVVILLV